LNDVNGIGSAQQLFDATQAAPASSANRTAKTDGGSTTAPGLDQFGVAAPVDEARWSSTSAVLAQAASTSDVRMEKVAALQQSIGDGTYFVASSNVAAGVMNALMH
jgi:negative regulator of flagellin synthesis FlgM